MRILAVADIHGTARGKEVCIALVERYQPDVVAVAGDITHFGPPEWAKEFLDGIGVETVAVHGNCDPPEVIEYIEKSRAHNIHLRVVELKGLRFVGMGGSNPPPFRTLVQYPESEFRKLQSLAQKNCILISHTPPYGHLDVASSGTHTGSRTLLEIIEQFAPRLVISAHIHEARGIERDERSTYVNPGPAAKGYGAVISIGEDVSARLVEI